MLMDKEIGDASQPVERVEEEIIEEEKSFEV